MGEVRRAPAYGAPELIERLAAERLLVPAGSWSGEAARPEDVFYWNHGADAAIGRENVGKVEIARLRRQPHRTAAPRQSPELRLPRGLAGRPSRSPQPRLLQRPRRASPRDRRGDGHAAATPSKSGRRKPDAADCHIVCSDFGGLDLMRDWNRKCVADEILFYPIVLEDEVASLGPAGRARRGALLSNACSPAGTPTTMTRRWSAPTEAHPFFGR